MGYMAQHVARTLCRVVILFDRSVRGGGGYEDRLLGLGDSFPMQPVKHVQNAPTLLLPVVFHLSTTLCGDLPKTCGVRSLLAFLSTYAPVERS